MRYLIVSDLHANIEALHAVLAQSAGGYDRAICCGDLVGYGADPNQVCDWVRLDCAVVVRGNHDRASTGQDDLEWFNPVARNAAMWTLHTLSRENTDYIVGLPRGPLTVGTFQVFHGSPYDEDEYVIAAGEAGQAFSYMESRVAFFGHTHVQGGFIWNHSRVETILRTPARTDSQAMPIDPGCAYMINPGSTGQPRDGDPRAAYAIYDTEANEVTYRRVVYDVAAAQKKIHAAGLPPILADRLAVGR
ncbi:MAG: metallophosphoesterase family protein [Candidatus Solibacter sp.]|nr:metallophosphoesterase family protein [Candidatus Solibacter sp.]